MDQGPASRIAPFRSMGCILAGGGHAQQQRHTVRLRTVSRPRRPMRRGPPVNLQGAAAAPAAMGATGDAGAWPPLPRAPGAAADGPGKPWQALAGKPCLQSPSPPASANHSSWSACAEQVGEGCAGPARGEGRKTPSKVERGPCGTTPGLAGLGREGCRVLELWGLGTVGAMREMRHGQLHRRRAARPHGGR